MDFYYEMIEISENMLKSTLKLNAKKMCNILKKIHLEKIKSENEIDNGNLKRVIIDNAYFSVRRAYDVDEIIDNEKSGVSIIFYPKDRMKPLIIMEVTLNSSARKAIEQIYKNQDYYGLKNKGYKGTYLLVGLNLNTQQTLYSCVVEECNCDLKYLTSNEYLPPKSERRSKVFNEYDVNAKRLRIDSERNTNSTDNKTNY